uniref:3-hydroxyisobutyryl-CoA hydrolase, mitochondrial n=1 Tax=Plectus sambesii TaxID=2011161 RepID=A0A914VNL6_9BILA
LGAMESALISMPAEKINESQIDRLLGDFQRQSPTLPSFSLEPHLDQINSIFDGSTVEEIVDKLKADGSDWARKQLTLLEKMSPTSLQVTFRQLTQGARLSFKDVFTMEYRLTQRFVEDNDFFEGCRASQSTQIV